MATTPKFALPYPLPSAPVSAGAADIRALAERLELVITRELAYAQFVTDVPVTATSVATAHTLVTAPAVTCDGATTIMVDFYANAIATPGSAGAYTQLWLFEDGVAIGAIAIVLTPAAAVTRVPVMTSRRLTPAAGARTYSVRAMASSAGGTVFAGPGGAGTSVPSFIRVIRA